MREEWHRKIEELVTPGYRRMVLHALIELGHPLECEMPVCRMLDRTIFEHYGKQALSIDHAEGKYVEGRDQPWNLRFSHLGCNVSDAVRKVRRSVRKTTDPGSLDMFKYLTPMQQESVTYQHGGVDPDSCWRFEAGVAILIEEEP